MNSLIFSNFADMLEAIARYFVLWAVECDIYYRLHIIYILWILWFIIINYFDSRRRFPMAAAENLFKVICRSNAHVETSKHAPIIPHGTEGMRNSMRIDDDDDVFAVKRLTTLRAAERQMKIHQRGADWKSFSQWMLVGVCVCVRVPGLSHSANKIKVWKDEEIAWCWGKVYLVIYPSQAHNSHFIWFGAFSTFLYSPNTILFLDFWFSVARRQLQKNFKSVTAQCTPYAISNQRLFILLRANNENTDKFSLF